MAINLIRLRAASVFYAAIIACSLPSTSLAQVTITQLTQRAEQGDVEAQNDLGAKYAEGEGVAQNDLEAVRWYQRAARQGHPVAQFNLGSMYYSGRGVARDFSEAFRLWLLAGEQGHADSQVNVGIIYESGQFGITSQNYTEAMRWFRLAADQGNPKAQFNIGQMFYNGLGVDKDLSQAVRFWKLSAEKGDSKAQFNLGHFYQNLLIPRDYVAAYMWYTLAGMQGHELAWGMRDLVARRMSGSQISAALSLAGNCRKQGLKDCGP